MHPAETRKVKVWWILWQYRLSQVFCVDMLWHLDSNPWCFKWRYCSLSFIMLVTVLSVKPSPLSLYHHCISSLVACQVSASANKRLNSIQRLASVWLTWVTHTATSAMEALTCLPPMDLVVQGKARLRVHRLLCQGVLVLPQFQSRT